LQAQAGGAYLETKRKRTMKRLSVKMNTNNTIFLLCDIQERFREAISYFPAVVHVAQRMSAVSKIANVPLIVSEQNPSRLGKTVQEIEKENEDNKNVIKYEKTLFSMCTPEINSLLLKANYAHAVLFGIEAHVCVQQTALDLVEKGIKVHILADGTSSRRNIDRFLAFDLLKQHGVNITSSESLIFQLMANANHPNFKQLSAFVKTFGPETGLFPNANAKL